MSDTQTDRLSAFRAVTALRLANNKEHIEDLGKNIAAWTDAKKVEECKQERERCIKYVAYLEDLLASIDEFAKEYEEGFHRD